MKPKKKEKQPASDLEEFIKNLCKEHPHLRGEWMTIQDYVKLNTK